MLNDDSILNNKKSEVIQCNYAHDKIAHNTIGKVQIINE